MNKAKFYQKQLLVTQKDLKFKCYNRSKKEVI